MRFSCIFLQSASFADDTLLRSMARFTSLQLETFFETNNAAMTSRMLLEKSSSVHKSGFFFQNCRKEKPYTITRLQKVIEKSQLSEF